MILNLLHRPERGKHHALYRLQQQYAHGLKLKTTLMVSVQVMEDERLAEEVRRDHEEHGDEIALWLWSFSRTELGGKAPFWLLSREHKRRGLAYALELFRSRFGRNPRSIGCYVLDAPSMEMIRELCPDATTVIASCFEEGVKVYHGCNHSWFLFSEGGPWGPWYPAKGHSLRPAFDETDWSGLVAVPHLSRDLALAYEGRNDFFASHPANVQRGLGNRGLVHPYDFNLADQYRMQEDFNDGFSFYHVHVSASWLGECPNTADPPEVSRKIYLETLEYLARLRDEGHVRDMHMSEFGEWFRRNVPIGKPMAAVGKEMLFGSGKHFFWYIDPHFRVLVDASQGGSIGDLRPYAGRFASFTGPEAPRREIATYPYLIQSQLRTGAVNHFADGARTTLFVSDGNETVDLCYADSRIEAVERSGPVTRLTLAPVAIRFRSGLEAVIGTVYEFGDGTVTIRRKLLSLSDSKAALKIREYFKGCYGFTEYGEDLKGVVLEAESGEGGREALEFRYASRAIRMERCRGVRARVPQIGTAVSLEPADRTAEAGSIREGHLFDPYFTLELEHLLTNADREAVTWLTVRKLD